MRRSGFANPEPMILIAILAILAAIVIPKVWRAFQRSRNATLIAVVQGVRAGEDAYFGSHHRYADSTELAPAHAPGVTIQEWRADSTGWGLVVVGDSGKAKGHHCGMFDGGEQFRPLTGSGEVGSRRELACW